MIKNTIKFHITYQFDYYLNISSDNTIFWIVKGFHHPQEKKKQQQQLNKFSCKSDFLQKSSSFLMVQIFKPAFPATFNISSFYLSFFQVKQTVKYLSEREMKLRVLGLQCPRSW